MTGIYKITTPSNKIYIGQSREIETRWKYHKYGYGNCISNISRSIKKYGAEQHIFSVVTELPSDITSEILTNYEMFYMEQYRACGFILLNIADAAGSAFGRKCSEEQKRRHSETMKDRTSPFKGKKHTEESKQLIKEKRALQAMPNGYKRLAPVWNKGLKGVQVGYNKGKQLSKETKEKLRLANIGKKLSLEMEY
jgi:group I intron endonuclease